MWKPGGQGHSSQSTEMGDNKRGARTWDTPSSSTSAREGHPPRPGLAQPAMWGSGSRARPAGAAAGLQDLREQAW